MQATAMHQEQETIQDVMPVANLETILTAHQDLEQKVAQENTMRQEANHLDLAHQVRDMIQDLEAELGEVLPVVVDILEVEAVVVAVAEGNKNAFYNIYLCCNLKQYTNEDLYNNI